MKKLLTILILITLSGCSRPFGLDKNNQEPNLGVITNAQINTILASVIQKVEDGKVSKGTWTQYPFFDEQIDTKTDIKYKIDRYEVWGGNESPAGVGYQIYLTKPDGYTMSTGTGSLTQELSYDWYLPAIIITTTTPSSTPQ